MSGPAGLDAVLTERSCYRARAAGREFAIVRHWFEPGRLQRLPEAHGWDAQVRATGEFLLYAEAGARGSWPGQASTGTRG